MACAFLEVKLEESVCLLCRNPRSAHTITTDDGRVVESSELAFKILLRYINMEVEDLVKSSSYQNQGHHDHHQQRLLGMVVESLCGACASVTNTFYEVYNSFEVARLQLSQCVQMVCDRMKNCGIGGAMETVEDEIVKDEVFRKCNLALCSMPKVSVVEIMKKEAKVKTKQEINIVPPAHPPHVAWMGNHQNSHSSEQHFTQRPPAPPNKVKSEKDYSDNSDDDPDFTASGIRKPLSKKVRVAPKTFKCRKCGRYFTNGRGLHSHMKEHENDNEEAPAPPRHISCGHCGAISKDPQSHQSHVLLKHPIEFFSEDLPEGTTKEQLESVIKPLLDRCTKYHGNGQSYTCTICTKLFAHPFEWRVHVLEGHFEAVVSILERGDEVFERVAREMGTTSSIAPSPRHAVGSGLTGGGGGSGGGPIRRRKVAPSKLVRCDHCDRTSSDARVHQVHMKMQHTFHFFFNSLPAGTTEFTLNNAINTLYNEVGHVKLTSGEKFRCPCCKALSGRFSDCKVHILSMHFETVLQRLATHGHIPTEINPALSHSKSFNKGPGFVRSKKKNFRDKYLKSRTSTDPLWVRCPDNPSNYRCIYCGKTTTMSDPHRYHVLSLHAMQYFASRLPAGTTEEALENAVSSIADKGKVVPMTDQKYKKRFYCPVCPPNAPKHYHRPAILRCHLLHMHFNRVLAKLGVSETMQAKMEKYDNDDGPISHQEEESCGDGDDDENESMVDNLLKSLDHQPQSSNTTNNFHSAESHQTTTRVRVQVIPKVEAHVVEDDEEMESAEDPIYHDESIPPNDQEFETEEGYSDDEGNTNGGDADDDPLGLGGGGAGGVETEFATINQESGGGAERFECEECHERFPTSNTLINHYRRNHAETPLLSCGYCNGNYNSVKELNIHLMASHLKAVFSREVPEGTTEMQLRGALECQGSRTHEGKMECRICRKHYPDKVLFFIHLKKRHLADILQELSEVQQAQG